MGRYIDCVKNNKAMSAGRIKTVKTTRKHFKNVKIRKTYCSISRRYSPISMIVGRLLGKVKTIVKCVKEMEVKNIVIV